LSQARAAGSLEGDIDEKVTRVKWIAIGLGVVALAVGAFALTTQGGGKNMRQIVTTVPSPAGALTPASTAKPDANVAKRAPSAAQPTSTEACQRDTSDATGDDCAAAQNDDQAGDSQARDNEPDENDNGD
jgi:hypothetical protein